MILASSQILPEVALTGLPEVSKVRCMATNPLPTIECVRHSESLGDLVVDVEPFRTDDLDGQPVVVYRWYGNGGLITAEGFRVKKDGAEYARLQVLRVGTPTNVREALGR